MSKVVACGNPVTVVTLIQIKLIKTVMVCLSTFVAGLVKVNPQFTE